MGIFFITLYFIINIVLTFIILKEGINKSTAGYGDKPNPFFVVSLLPFFGCIIISITMLCLIYNGNSEEDE